MLPLYEANLPRRSWGPPIIGEQTPPQRGEGKRDEPLRTSAWEANTGLVIIAFLISIFKVRGLQIHVLDTSWLD